MTINDFISKYSLSLTEEMIKDLKLCEVEQSPKSKEEKIKKQKEELAHSIAQFKNIYPREVLLEFYNYWSEECQGATPKIRQKLEKTWNTKLRLERWVRNNPQKVLFANSNNNSNNDGPKSPKIKFID